MARHSPVDPEVRRLINELVPLFLTVGSVNALQQLLVGWLPADRSQGWLYPNRLHALLSEDPTRAVNTQTLNTVQFALAHMEPATSPEEMQLRTHELRTQVLASMERYRRQGASDLAEMVQQVAVELQVPPAVVRWLLPAAVTLQLGGTPSEPVLQSPAITRPDWSFQDHAYDSCVLSLRRSPNRKVGLVLPTGAGKTRVAMRILLRILADSERADSVVLWITHRGWLRRQARRELQRAMTDGTPDLPEDAVALLSQRVRIVMISDIARCLQELGDRVVLVVVDEAHHMAAPSYQPIFQQRSLRGLFLTATPNRTDALPLGIDEIAYTITYRELFERGVLIEPSLEHPLTIESLDWGNPSHLRDMADFILGRAEEEFIKTMVVTSRIEHLEQLYTTIIDELDGRPDHVLSADDVGWVHGSGSSNGTSADEFLDEFAALPRGIILATAQLLGEGFDDPTINAVVITYPTTSMIQLMQVAGRCLRYAPGKDHAYVVQVKESALAYHYEQRWLYQDISDALHPQLIDYRYTTADELEQQVEELLGQYHVLPNASERVHEALKNIQVGEAFSVLLTGLPYYGPAHLFTENARWSAVPVLPSEREQFLHVFNDFSVRDSDVNQPSDFLRNYVPVDPARKSTWRLFRDMLDAMVFARGELTGAYNGEIRGYVPSKGTTWLTYVTFTHHAQLPYHVEQFLRDVVNRETIISTFVQSLGRWRSGVKVPLPLAGTWAYLLDEDQSRWFEEQRAQVITMLKKASPLDSFSILDKWRVGLGPVPVPQLVLDRFETFIPEGGYDRYMCTI